MKDFEGQFQLYTYRFDHLDEMAQFLKWKTTDITQGERNETKYSENI